MKKFRFVNTGKKPDDGKGDRLRDAFDKINFNFSILSEKFKLKEHLKCIVWNDIEDTSKAMEDVNYNFKIIEEHLS